MPRDIRSYFTAPVKKGTDSSVPKRKTRAVISSDEDEDKPRIPIKRAKLTEKPFKIHILSDSDDDVNNIEGTKSTRDPKNKIKKKEIPQRLISPADVFGSKPIVREEANKIKITRKQEAVVHNDDDFEATLCQLDTSQIEEEYLNESNTEKEKDHKETLEEHSKKREHEESDHKKIKQHKHSEHAHETNKKENEKEEKHNDKRKRKNIDDENKSKGRKQRKSSSDSAKESSSKPHFEKSPKRDYKIEIVDKKSKKSSQDKSPDIYEERIEKKKHNVAMYHKYLERGGARNPGSKEIPEGADNCLAGLSFLITGVLDSLEREEAEELIKRYGGRVLHQVSGKTNYVIVGDDPGPAKLTKAESLRVPKITEDDLLELIRTRPAGRAANVKQSHAKSKSKPKPSESGHVRKRSSKSTDDDIEEKKKETKPVIAELAEGKSKPTDEEDTLKTQSTKVKLESDVKVKVEEFKPQCETNQISPTDMSPALVEKYRPKTMKQILGQQGDKSNAKKLYNWLENWYKNRSKDVKLVKPNPWAKNDDGGFFKAALLSGPPGIGKTTTAQVVCNELGMDLVEMNASDTRNKKLLKEEVSDLLSNTTMKGYFSDSKAKPTAKHVLLMDEVDGMAGNEDRGGLQELISLIKSTEVPIICICNDRNNPKMRTLSNYTFDLKFSKPRLEQIRGAMKSICYKEHIDISSEDLDRLIESTNQDIRQVINHLALLANNSTTQEKTDKKHINKDLRLGPWDVARKVFSSAEHKTMTIYDKSDLFFHDYNIAPLFVQENYLLVMPQAPKNEILERVAESADSIAIGDVVEKAIRSGGSWSLLPVQACYSSVIPGTMMSGHITAQINFPSWLGRNSKRNKFDRLTQEIAMHSRLTTGASKEAINLDYLTHLRDAIIRPLATNDPEGVEKSINIMNQYHLLRLQKFVPQLRYHLSSVLIEFYIRFHSVTLLIVREDLDSLVEISLWPNQRDPFQIVDSKVKAAFTRAYNKHSAALPYAVHTTAKKKATQSSQEEDLIEGEEENDGGDTDEEDENVETDKMIKAKNLSVNKKVAGPSEKSTKKNPEKPAKRGRGRGKAK